jgi:hypothetical protein
MGASLDVGGNEIGTGLRKGVDIRVHWGYHQMHVHDAFDMGAYRSAGRGAKADVGHKMSIHHVDMDPISALCLDGGAFGTEISEIGCKN